MPGQRCWVAHVDVLVLECAGGNLYDVVSLAVRAALANTDVQVTEAITDADGEVSPPVRLLPSPPRPVLPPARQAREATLKPQLG